MRVLAALDKFKGTASSADLGAAVVRAARASGLPASAVALSDGGDGLLAAFGGAERSTAVTGPLGTTVSARWRLDGTVAVIESATASGLVLAGGADGNDPMTATSRGTGQLIEAAVSTGARDVIVGLGGSACTDGGLAAVRALSTATLRAIASGEVVLVVCCDVVTRYVDAAVEFAPQKGATAEQVVLLTRRLREARTVLRERLGVDVDDLPGGGAAGGLGGGLAAIGGRLRPGFDVVAERTRLAASVAAADLVVTGEGQLDRSSFAGKVVGGVAALADAAGTKVAAIVGSVAPGTPPPPFATVSLVARFGTDAAFADPLGCVERATRSLLAP
ncbi:glycerate kinase [Jatrophihabitans endophyticus]|uniref:Glycerate kinase n=1 Tax=Jatrophihabitans endophyticus TaxID=1206085 RepID=A0A1M5KVB5_9ACTN|nr:glycerate kinase [Jatrophihabitans endophyticus]SHG56469.1 glycerate kinase [Jatrophihabitans endophyticus]